MGSVLDYFVRHITLVLDNDEVTYNRMARTAIRIVRNSGVTVSEWKKMNSEDRRDEYAMKIGERLVEIIEDEYLAEAVSDGTVGAQLISEVMITGDSAFVYEIGSHYIPEDADVVDLLDDEDEDED